MQQSHSHKPLVAVSACLMGQNVRYDGGHKYSEFIVEFLRPIAQVVTFCPEVAAGLGTPRPPIKLIKLDSSSIIRAIGVDDSTVDVTNALTKVGNNYSTLFSQVDGIIFKARSPSCGLANTEISYGGKVILGNGIFAELISKSCPQIELIDEEGFMDKLQRESFLAKLCNK